MARPAVDILLPYHGQYESVSRCIGSIFSCTPNQDYQIILIDDASPNTSYFRNLTTNRKKVKGVQLEEQVGFGGALAAGFEISKNPLILILHSDVWVDNINWLANLQRGLGRLKNEGIKLVCAKSNDPGTSISYDKKMFQAAESSNTIVETACPLLCALCHRDLFTRIGGFIKKYPFAWYEDEELFWRMKYYGYKQAIIGNSFVHHDGGLTVTEVLKSNPKARRTMENNHSLCLDDIAPFLPKKSQI